MYIETCYTCFNTKEYINLRKGWWGKMEFEQGDRVHVTRLNGEKVDFYATIGDLFPHGELIKLVNCIDKSFEFEGVGVYLPNNEDFGPDEDDYYTLVTDEEDSELPAIQHDKLIKEVEKPREENNTLKSENKALRLQADEYFKLWQEQERKYNKLTEHIRLKALHNPSISRYIDLVCFINEMEDE